MQMFLKKCKDRLYHFLVEANVHVKYYHQKWVSEDKRSGKYSLAKSMLYLIKLTLVIRVLRLKKYRQQAGVKPYLGGSESALSYKCTPQEYSEKLMKYDVISFDIFDTLVFRPFQNPTDLFHIVGQKLEYMDFANIRVQSERKVRMEHQEKNNSDEITIYDIYEYMEKYCGVSAKEGVNSECETELDLIYSNPYMKQVYDILIQGCKKIIAVSDIYLTKDIVANILRKCGYGGIYEIFVSSEYRYSKHDGRLFKTAKAVTGDKYSYVHIGDNWRSDYENARKYGFDSIHYENVNHKGGYYRPYDMSAIVGSAYRGIVNAHLHNGLKKYTMHYEYGFFCGGIFVLGYCNYIHQYAQNNGIDKILFLSRDGEILKKIYDKLYPGNNSEYVYWSRSVATKLGSNKFRYDYFRRFIYHKVNTDTTIVKIFQAMELDSILSQFENDKKIDRSVQLTSKNANTVINWISSNWQRVMMIYDNENEAAKRYYSPVIGNFKKVCTVDIGWAGSGGVVLAYLVKDVWKLNCEMFTLVAGTNTAHSYEPNMSEGFLQSRQMISYLYSQSHNRHFYHFHNPNAMHNVFLEMLLSSKTASLKGFKKTDDSKGYEFIFSENNHTNDVVIDEIHRGIIDFVDTYCNHFQNYRYMFNISGNDAYVAFSHLTADNKYFKELFKGLCFDIGVGEDIAERIFKA